MATTALPPSAAPVEEHRFPCPGCGAVMRYRPGSEVLECGHCGTEEPIAAPRGQVPALPLHDGRPPDLAPEDIEETRVVTCASCGAQTEFDEAVHAAECPFCAAPIVTDTGTHRHIKPHAQLPFAISEAEARAAMARWLGRLWFAPNDLKAYARADRRLAGLYVPYWSYDADTETRYRGQRGDTYYVSQPVMVTVKGKQQMQTRQVAKVRWRPASGTVSRRFRDVLVLGSTSLPRRYAEALEPWDTMALAAYEPRYLAGFRAEGYSVPLEEGFGQATRIMERTIAQDVRMAIGGDQQRIDAMDTRARNVGFKHVLLPVWLAAYRFEGRTYRFVVNGRTGAVQGERPWSKVKIALAVVIGLVAAAILGIVILQA